MQPKRAREYPRRMINMKPVTTYFWSASHAAETQKGPAVRSCAHVRGVLPWDGTAAVPAA
jgi:hypothetical protein